MGGVGVVVKVVDGVRDAAAVSVGDGVGMFVRVGVCVKAAVGMGGFLDIATVDVGVDTIVDELVSVGPNDVDGEADAVGADLVGLALLVADAVADLVGLALLDDVGEEIGDEGDWMGDLGGVRVGVGLRPTVRDAV